MTAEQTLSSLTSLPVEEQIRVLQMAWDQMPKTAGTFLSDEQRDEFDRRVARFRKNPESGLSESELRKQIRDARS